MVCLKKLDTYTQKLFWTAILSVCLLILIHALPAENTRQLIKSPKIGAGPGQGPCPALTTDDECPNLSSEGIPRRNN
jgi:hypothetical protein